MSLPTSPGKVVRSAARIFAAAFLLLQPAAVVQPAVRPQAVAEPVSPQQEAEAPVSQAEAPVSRLRVVAEQAWRPQEEAEQVAAAQGALAREVPAVRPQAVVAGPVSPQQAAEAPVSRLRVAAEQAWLPQAEAEPVAAAQGELARVAPTGQPAAQVASPVAGAEGASPELPQVGASWDARWKAQLELLASAALPLAWEVEAAAGAPRAVPLEALASADPVAVQTAEPSRSAEWEWMEPFGRCRVGAA